MRRTKTRERLRELNTICWRWWNWLVVALVVLLGELIGLRLLGV